MAVVTALFAAMLSVGLGLSIVLLGMAETTLAAHDRDARTLAYGSRAAAALAIGELRALASLADVGAAGVEQELSATPGAFVDSTLTPAAPWGMETLNLRSLTAAIQAEADAGVPSRTHRPIWRLFVFGRFDGLTPQSAGGMPCYLAAWVADEGGLLLVRAAAYGPGDARALTEVSLAPPGEGGGAPSSLRILAVRPDP